jgi:hypothetical protein
VLVEGTAVYVLENGENPGFRNIPQAIYWAIVTITTVGSQSRMKSRDRVRIRVLWW